MQRVCEGKVTFGFRAFRSRWVGHPPMRGHWLSRPDGTDFFRGVVAHGEDKIEFWRACRGELIPRLRAQSASIVVRVVEHLYSHWVDVIRRLAPGAESSELATS